MHELKQIPVSSEMKECISLCEKTRQNCITTVIHCKQSDFGRFDSKDIRLLKDCGDICQTNANFLLRGSERYTYTCATCSEICDICAQNCAQYSDDFMMLSCADLCRECASACHNLAGIPV